MEECLRASYTVKPLSYLSRNAEFLVTGAAFPVHVVDVILAWLFPLLPFKKYATESLQGCEGANKLLKFRNISEPQRAPNVNVSVRLVYVRAHSRLCLHCGQ